MTVEEDEEAKLISFIPFNFNQNIVDGYAAAEKFRAKVDAQIAEEKAREERLKNIIKDIDGNALTIGDTVISSTNKGVVKYKIVGETECKWKVVYLSGDKRKDSMKLRKIDKSIDLFKI